MTPDSQASRLDLRGTQGGTAIGRAADDILIGSDADDIFDGSGGNDRITTGQGQDIVVVRGNGTLTVTDFAPGSDRLGVPAGLTLRPMQQPVNSNFVRLSVSDGGTVALHLDGNLSFSRHTDVLVDYRLPAPANVCSFAGVQAPIGSSSSSSGSSVPVLPVVLAGVIGGGVLLSCLAAAAWTIYWACRDWRRTPIVPPEDVRPVPPTLPAPGWRQQSVPPATLPLSAAPMWRGMDHAPERWFN